MPSALVDRPIPASMEESETLRVIRRLKELGLGDYENGPWIAGGAALKLAMGTDDATGDYDIFFPIEMDVDPFKTILKAEIPRFAYSQAEVHSGVTTFQLHIPGMKPSSYSMSYPVQFIEFCKYRSLHETLKSFDFTVAQFATDGETIRGTQEAWDDLDAKILRLLSTNRKTLWRIPKYCAKGFSPEPDLLLKAYKGCVRPEMLNPSTGCVIHDGTY